MKIEVLWHQAHHSCTISAYPQRVSGIPDLSSLRSLSLLVNLLIALLIVNASLGLLNLNRLLDVLGPCLSINGTKHNINLLKGELLSLGNEDPYEDGHAHAEDGEHQERAPADAVDGCGCDLGDDEVEEPLGGGWGEKSVEVQKRGFGRDCLPARPTPYARSLVGKISDTSTQGTGPQLAL
jgi:hypothetical protein